MEDHKSNQADVLDREVVNELLSRAQDGDLSVLPELRAFLDLRPDVWQKAGDLAEYVREALLSLAGQQSLLLKESVRRKMSALELELAGEAPSRLERLLVERVVISWAQLHLADLDNMNKDLKGAVPGPHHQRRQDAAMRRYLAAIKALATVRSLLRRPVSPLQFAMQRVEESSAVRSERVPFRGAGLPVVN